MTISGPALVSSGGGEGGSVGPQGPQGPQGPEGPEGPQGPPGESAEAGAAVPRTLLEAPYELARVHASDRAAWSFVELANPTDAELTFANDVFPDTESSALVYQLLLSGANVSIAVGSAGTYVEPAVASDIALVEFDGTGDPASSEYLDVTLGGTGFRPIGDSQVAFVTVQAWHRVSGAPIPFTVTPSVGEAVLVGGNIGHAPVDAAPWQLEPSWAVYAIALGDREGSPQDFTVDVNSTERVYAASATVSILDGRRLAAPLVISAAHGYSAGDADVSVGGVDSPETDVALFTFAARNFTTAPSAPFVTFATTPEAEPFASETAGLTGSAEFRHMAAAVFAGQAGEAHRVILSGANANTRRSTVRIVTRQAAVGELTYVGTANFERSLSDIPTSVTLVAFPGRRLLQV